MPETPPPPPIPASVVALLDVSDRPPPDKSFAAGFSRQENKDIPAMIFVYPDKDNATITRAVRVSGRERVFSEDLETVTFSHAETVVLIDDGAFGPLAWVGEAAARVNEHSWRALAAFVKEACKKPKKISISWEKYQDRLAQISQHCPSLAERNFRIEVALWKPCANGGLYRHCLRMPATVFRYKDGSGWGFVVTDHGPDWQRHYDGWERMDYATRPKYAYYPGETKHWSDHPYPYREQARCAAVKKLDALWKAAEAEEAPVPEGLEDIW